VFLLFNYAFIVEYCVELNGRVTEQRQTAKNLEVSIRGVISVSIDGFPGADGNKELFLLGESIPRLRFQTNPS
jgi:hypothetical protein